LLGALCTGLPKDNVGTFIAYQLECLMKTKWFRRNSCAACPIHQLYLYIHVPAGSSLLRSRDVYLSVDSLTEPYSYAVGLPFPIRLRRFPHLSLLSSTNRCCCCCCVVAISGVRMQQCDILKLQSPVIWLASIACLSRECMSVRRVESRVRIVLNMLIA